MCTVSVIMDYGRRDIWPNQWLPQQPALPLSQTVFPAPLPPVPPEVTPEYLKHFLKLYEAAKAFDAATGQPDCEDPAKAQVLERVIERLAEIEKRLGIASDAG